MFNYIVQRSNTTIGFQPNLSFCAELRSNGHRTGRSARGVQFNVLSLTPDVFVMRPGVWNPTPIYPICHACHTAFE